MPTTTGIEDCKSGDSPADGTRLRAATTVVHAAEPGDWFTVPNSSSKSSRSVISETNLLTCEPDRLDAMAGYFKTVTE